MFYDRVPASNKEERRLLLLETRSHLELAEKVCALADGPELSDSSRPISPAVEVRLDALRRMFNCVEVLHSAEEILLNKKVPEREALDIGLLANAILNASAAREYALLDPSARLGDTRLASLIMCGAHAPNETKRIVQALLAMGKEHAWCRASWISRPVLDRRGRRIAGVEDV